MIYEWLNHIDFAYPYVLLAIALIPVLWCWRIKKTKKQQPSIKVTTVQAFLWQGGRAGFMRLPFYLRLLAIASLVIALARPQKRNDQIINNGEGIDIVLCMDVSGSMGSRDILPSRMEVAKEVAQQFVLDRPVDRIGLVIFSGESFTQCPVTTDKNTLVSQLQSLESRQYLTDGTVIGEGLATAVDRLRTTKAASKIIILLTDGKEDPPETRLIDPYTAIEIAKAQRIKVYTIGMGGDSATVANLASRKGARSADFLDEGLLRKIAGETGGQYFRARDKDALVDVYKQIDRLEKSKVETIAYRHNDEMFFPFALAACLFLFIELLLRYVILKSYP